MKDLAEIILPMVIMSVPIIAIIGGITAAIIRSNGRHRLLELAQRERIAAIERGVDPERLPQIQLPSTGNEDDRTFVQKQKRRSQLLLIWGMIVVGFGLPLYIGIGLSDGFRDAAPALMFTGVGSALMLGSRFTRPSEEEIRLDREQQAARLRSA